MLQGLNCAPCRDAQLLNAGAEIGLGFLVLLRLFTRDRNILLVFLVWCAFVAPCCAQVGPCLSSCRPAVGSHMLVLRLQPGRVQRWKILWMHLALCRQILRTRYHTPDCASYHRQVTERRPCMVKKMRLCSGGTRRSDGTRRPHMSYVHAGVGFATPASTSAARQRASPSDAAGVSGALV